MKLKLKKPHAYMTASILIGAAIGLASSGCGKGPDVTQPDPSAPGAAPGAAPTNDGSVLPTNAPPSYSYQIKHTGSAEGVVVGGGTMTVAADTKLLVAIKAGTSMKISNTGYHSSAFNCQLFTVRVGNLTKVAFVKKASYTDRYASYWADPCTDAGTTWVGDFSAALSPGHGDLRVRVMAAQYDNCRVYNYYGRWGSDPYSGGCPLSELYSSHTTNAFVDIYTDYE